MRSSDAEVRSRIRDSSDANKRTPRELVLLWTNGADASMVDDANAARAHIIKT